MEIIDKQDNTNNAVNRIQVKRILRYSNKEDRDRACNLCNKAGIQTKKSTSSNQQLHPEYIEDYTGKIETGFGNSEYQTFFKKIYNLEEEETK